MALARCVLDTYKSFFFWNKLNFMVTAISVCLWFFLIGMECQQRLFFSEMRKKEDDEFSSKRMKTVASISWWENNYLYTWERN